MPDRDVFDRNVRRGWKTSSRLVICHGDDPDVLRSVIRALGNEIKREGCPGFDEIANIVVDSLQSHVQDTAVRRSFERLEHVKLEEASCNTELAVRAAKQFVLKPNPYCDFTSVTMVAVNLLAEFAVSRLCPAPMLALLAKEGGVPIRVIQARLNSAKLQLIASQEIQRLAEMLMADPTGTSVKMPRLPRVRLSQSDILLTALTAT